MQFSNSPSNTAIGYKALSGTNSDGYNTAVGVNAMRLNNSGYNNCALGQQALEANNTGFSNTGLGYNSLLTNTTGYHNTAIGSFSLNSNNGSENVALGSNALYNNANANKNVGIGKGALYNNTTGSNNTAIGCNAGGLLNSNVSNVTCIGSDVGWNTTGSNHMNIGNFSVTNIGGQVNWATYSDKRIKTNIQNNVPGLAFITKLKPVTYNVNIKEQYKLAMNGQEDTSKNYEGKYDIEQIKMTGFLAQDVEQAAKDCNYNFSGVVAPKDGKGLYMVKYSEFVVPLVQAVKEQQTMIDELKKQNEMLLKRLEKLEKTTITTK
jgi:hypothetical protein